MLSEQQQQEVIYNLVIQAANSYAEGKSTNEIVTEFESQGVPQDLAEAIAKRGEEIKKEEFKKSGKTTMLIGVGLAGLGVVITAGTYSAASGGGHYVVTYGLIIGGIWMFLKGMWRAAAG